MTARMKPAKDRPELAELGRRANEAFDALTPEQKIAHREAQRKSYVVGELMLENPDLTREEAEKRYHRALHHI